MAFHNVNYESKVLSGGTFTLGQLGNGITASTVHEIFCLTAGSVVITPMKGDVFTWAATAGQNIKVLVSQITVSSGSFVGFKAKYDSPQKAYYNHPALPPS